jgi:PAS domain S-box-containing protein
VEVERPEWVGQMEGVLGTLNEGVLITDDCHQIVSANDVMLQMARLPASAVLGRTPACFYSGEDQQFLLRQIERGQQLGRNRFEFYVPRSDGGRVPVMISARVLEDPDGRQFAVVTFTDITEQKEAEAQLRHANEKLEERQKEIEFELQLAARVQQSLAPKQLRWGCVTVDSFYLPVRTIGGDFGLVAPLDEEQLHLLVCDVSGHGIGSALVANRIYTETLSLLDRRVEPGELLRQLNRFVLEQIQVSGFWFSMALARLRREGRRLEFAAGGHPPAICVSTSGETRRLESRGMVLGALPGAVPEEATETLELRPGDRLALYTDGLTDVFNDRDEMLGVEGLEEIVRRAARGPLEQMKQAVLDGVAAWRHGPPNDDISLILVEIC